MSRRNKGTEPKSSVLLQTFTPNEPVSAEPSIKTAQNPVTPVTVESIPLNAAEKALVRQDETSERKADLQALSADGQSEHEVFSRSLDSIADEPLAEIVIDGVRKFREIIPAIVELRKRFNERPKGHAGISGCATWTEFCTKKLGRTLRAVQLALARPKTPQTDEEKADRLAGKELKARIDLDATRQLAAREESYLESKAFVTEDNEITLVPTVDPIPRAVPVVVKNQELEEYKLIAARNIQALEIADKLLPVLFDSSDATQHSQIMKYMKLRNIPLSSIPTLEKGVAIPYVEDFLSEEEAAALFALAQSLPRERPLTKMSGFKNHLRRLQMPCYSATPNWRGSENEKTNQWMMPIDEAPAEVKSLAEKLSKLAGKPVNYFSFVGYENEKDHIGWHQHGEDKCRDARVFIVSLGAVRTFGIRKLCDECRVCDDCNQRMCDGETQPSCTKCKQAHKHRKTCKVCNDKSNWTLLQPAHGSLITLPDSYNNTHEHAVLDDKGSKGFRVSINTKHISPEDIAAGNGYIPKEHRHDGPASKNAIVPDRPPFVREPGPPRIYCQRKGNEYPADAVNVDRKTIFGNHKRLNGDEWLAEVTSLMKSTEFAAQVEALRGKDLLCWCRPSEESRCHARAWLELANGKKSQAEADEPPR